jgi:hypothetical protein
MFLIVKERTAGGPSLPPIHNLAHHFKGWGENLAREYREGRIDCGRSLGGSSGFFLDRTQEQEQHNGADGGTDQGAEHPDRLNAQKAEYPTSEDGADDQIADQTKPATFDELTKRLKPQRLIRATAMWLSVIDVIFLP